MKPSDVHGVRFKANGEALPPEGKCCPQPAPCAPGQPSGQHG